MKLFIRRILVIVLLGIGAYLLLPPLEKHPDHPSDPITLDLPVAQHRDVEKRAPPHPPDPLMLPAESPVPEGIHIGDAPAPDAKPGDDTQAQAAEPDTRETWLEHRVKSGDSMSRIFRDLGFDDVLLTDILKAGKDARYLKDLHPGQALRVRLDNQGALEELVLERSPISSLHVRITEDGFDCELREQPLETRVLSASATVNSSLFLDGRTAGLSDEVIMEMADLFNWDIDFAREIRNGDHFSVIYEAHYLEGEKYRDGAILAAEFVNKGKTYRAIRYRDPKGVVDYYGPEGTAKKRAFIKTPVKFSRISSRFSRKRWHPVLKRWRSHKGVDYAAPTGTPVRAAGKGHIKFVGRQRGYGKVIILEHGDTYITVYGHLSKFGKAIKKGRTVAQGQVIGYVGQTGLATGPHLHYEFRVKGKHVDPLSRKLPTAMPLPKQYLADFRKTTGPLVAQLDLLSSPQGEPPEAFAIAKVDAE